ncbi:MAG: monofunctional biosynthetic peptidoglycan transglycosylase [Chitinophagales bacterium]
MVKRWSRLALRAMLYFLLISISTVLLFRWIPIPITPLMLVRVVQQKAAGKEMRLYKNWQSLDHITPQMPLAVMASEDQNYLDHYGFDTKAIEAAMTYNAKHKKKRGASTISQQTAKNVFLWPSRSWVRKGFEVYFTFLIELLWSKERIMEVYLNVIETGDGVYGVDAAAHYYFHKSAASLSAAQCAAIASILPSPLKWNPVRPSGFVASRQRWILGQMNNLSFPEK